MNATQSSLLEEPRFRVQPCSPLLKWPGGKRSELPEIRPFIPPHQRYFEPFFGGGSVFFDSISVPSHANDMHPDLMLFYRFVKETSSEFFDLLTQSADEWDWASHEQREVMYYRCRQRYNAAKQPSVQRAVDFFLLRELAYGGMFRVNSNGHFNVPFGRAYARNKDIRKKIEYLQSHGVQVKMRLLEISALDFGDFLDGFTFDTNDFMFVDPPYDSSFSRYNRSDFGRVDQERLAERLHSFDGRFMLVCKGTPLIEDLYFGNGYSFRKYDYKYRFNIKGRFSRASTHFMIANYDLNFGKRTHHTSVVSAG